LAVGVNLVAPIEVGNEDEIWALVFLARQLNSGQTKLGLEFSDYRYGRADWVKEQAKIDVAHAWFNQN
jgi:hypothetical protein